jgi:hypothetical protein
MKITVVTGRGGKVLATIRQPKADLKDGPRFGFIPREPGHKVHEIELPSHMEEMQSPEELHRALKEHLAKARR